MNGSSQENDIMTIYKTLHSESDNPKTYFKSIVSARKNAYNFNVSTGFGPDYNYIYDVSDGKKKIVGTVVANGMHTDKGNKYFAIYVPEGQIGKASYLNPNGTLGKKVTLSESKKMFWPLDWRYALKHEEIFY